MAKHAYETLTTQREIFEATVVYIDMNGYEYRVVTADSQVIGGIIPSPGRHRYADVMTDSPSAVYRVPFIDSNSMNEPSAQSRLYPGKWECPREWIDGIAVGFEYL